MINIKADIQHHNYVIKHVPRVTKCIADCLSRRPGWLVTDTDSPDYNGDPDEEAFNSLSNEEHWFREITEARHLLRDNPA